MQRVVIVGDGAHARVVADAILAANTLEIAGFLGSEKPNPGIKGLPWKYLGSEEFLSGPDAASVQEFVIAIGGIRRSFLRETLFELVLSKGFAPAIVIHPSSVVSPFSKLGRGTVILARAVVNPFASVGENVIVNTGAIIEHDCVLKDHAHVAPGAVLTGGVKVGRRTTIGANSVVLPGLQVGDDAIVGAGSVVTRDVLNGTTVAGNPARLFS